MISFLWMVPTILISLLNHLGHAQTVRTSNNCKGIPGQTGWPSSAEWKSLNNAVKGHLLKPTPPAAACHGLTLGDCSAISSGFKDSAWHAGNPVSNMWQNYNNYSCTPSSTTCTGQGYPVFVVEAQGANDVKAAIDFARTKNIRLNVKSTGHDFLGRSVQPYSLSIWTHKLNDIKWHDTPFQPLGCSITIPGAAVTVGAGAQWGQVNSAARKRRLNVVSGAFSTVSLGGFLANGGHGPLSAKYGLGADNVYQIELLSPASEIIVANECQNTEYFWAMRGGGGSTYGVALRYTIAAHKDVGVARYSTKLYGWTEIANWHRGWPKLAMVGASGYFNGYPGRGGEVKVNFSVPGMSQFQLERLVEPIMASLQRPGGVIAGSNTGEIEGGGMWKKRDTKEVSISRQRGTYEEYASYADESHRFMKRESAAASLPFPGIGTNKLIASWLWSPAHLASSSLEKALRGAFDASAQMLNDATIGVGTHNPPFMRGEGNAVNPAFRTAVMRPATELQWEGTNKGVLESKKRDSLRFVASYASIALEGGTYANEVCVS